MREIKFRAWDGKRMIEPYVKLSEYGVSYSEYIESPDNLEIMQFTGLLDKNKKPIYEGDILKNNTYVYWDNSNAVFAACKMTYKDNPVSQGMLCEYVGDTTEIIGNIFENEDLIPRCEHHTIDMPF